MMGKHCHFNQNSVISNSFYYNFHFPIWKHCTGDKVSVKSTLLTCEKPCQRFYVYFFICQKKINLSPTLPPPKIRRPRLQPTQPIGKSATVSMIRSASTKFCQIRST